MNLLIKSLALICYICPLWPAGKQMPEQALLIKTRKGITILTGVFFRKIEALLRFKYFSFNTWNDNERQRAYLSVAVSMVFNLRVSIIVRVSIQPLSKSAVTGPPARPVQPHRLIRR